VFASSTKAVPLDTGCTLFGHSLGLLNYKSCIAPIHTSVDDFAQYVWPVVANHLGNGQLVAIEGVCNQHCRILDCQAGIDYLQLLPDGGVRGLAARVQTCSRAFETFTIRLGTELPKRLRDLSNGYLCPTHTLQAYLTPSKVIVGVIETSELYRQIKTLHKSNLLQIRTNTQDGNRFVCVKWRDLQSVTLL
jgi:hypothetical protein